MQRLEVSGAVRLIYRSLSVKGLIRLWDQLPAEALATFCCNSHIFRKRVRRVIISEKWGVFEAWWRNVQKYWDVENWGLSVVKCSEVKRCEVKWSDDFGWNVLSLIYRYVAACRFCSVRCLITICFWLSFFNYRTYVFLNIFRGCFCFVLCICFLFCVFSVFILFCLLFILLCV